MLHRRQLVSLAALTPLLAGEALAAPAPPGARTVGYGPDAKQALDIYPRSGLRNAPVILYIHGGGWRAGDKREVNALPDYARRHGFLLVSTNHRQTPKVDAAGCAEDVAAATAWTLDNAARHGGDPRRVFLIGHSSGAHLAALIAIDPAYLARRGRRPEQIAGVVALDGAGYDAPAQIAMTGGDRPALANMLTAAFRDRAAALSPTRLVRPGRRYPPFQIFHVARQSDGAGQSEGIARALRTAGAKVQLVPVTGDNHMMLNKTFGLAGDPEGDRAAAFVKTGRP